MCECTKESLKNFLGSHKLLQAHEKVCNKINKENNVQVKMLLMEGGL